MTSSPQRVRAVITFLILLGPIRLTAQSTDARIREPAASTQATAIYASLGLGVGSSATVSPSNMSGKVDLTVTRGRMLAVVRNAGVGSYLGAGKEHDETAVLAGFKSVGLRAFRYVTAGISHSSIVTNCALFSTSCFRERVGSGTGLAFQGGVEANAVFPGIGFDVFGAVGRREASFAAATISLQFGWFGRQ